MLEEELKNRIAQRYFKKFDCAGIIKRIDFTVCANDCRDAARHVPTSVLKTRLPPETILKFGDSGYKLRIKLGDSMQFF